MEKKVKIYCVNSNITNSYPAGISLEEICPKDVKAIVAKVNGKIKDLKFCVQSQDKSLSFPVKNGMAKVKVPAPASGKSDL